MASGPLLILSDELKLAIAEALEPDSDTGKKDLLNLSATCNTLRNFCVPYIFRSIILRNTEKSGRIVQEFADGPHAIYAKRLHYKGVTPFPEPFGSDERSEEERKKAIDETVPANVTEILSTLNARFPNLYSLTIEFPFDEDQWSYGFYHFDDDEAEENVTDAEANSEWRALMFRTFDAVAKNESPGIKALHLREMPAKEVSTWSDPSFRRLLGGLEDFSFSLRANDNGAGWNINTLDGYMEFVPKLSDFFFDHLDNVRTFSLAGAASGPIGLEGFRHTPVPLEAEHMPHLKHLHLKNVFLCRELIELLTTHSEIESVRMEDCHSSLNMADYEVQWHEFLTSLAKSNPKQLKSLEILPKYTPLTWDESYPEDGRSEDVPDEVLAAKEIMKNDSKKRLFSYINVDDKYGMIFDDTEKNLESFQDGVDQRAFDRVMDIIAKNLVR